MNEITTIGLDLAKQVFHVVGCDARGKEVKRKRLRRGQVRAYFANLAACVVGMEACAGAHFWVKLIRLGGHLILWEGGIHHAEIKTAVRAGVPAPDD